MLFLKTLKPTKKTWQITLTMFFVLWLLVPTYDTDLLVALVEQITRFVILLVLTIVVQFIVSLFSGRE